MSGVKVQCLACKGFSLQAVGPALARCGLGKCLTLPNVPGQMQSTTKQRECRHFVAADPAAVAKRRAFEERKPKV